MQLKVLIVDDSAVFRSILTRALDEVPGVEIVGTASNGLQALERVEGFEPDLVVLDVHMPKMDGVTALGEIKKRRPRTGVIMMSGIDGEEARSTLSAFRLGAFDFLAKPTSQSGKELFAPTLRRTIEAFRRSLNHPHPVASRPAGGADAAPQRRQVPAVFSAVAVGVSTGGPNSLAELFPRLSADIPVPIFLVQHMPAGFTRAFSESLDRACALDVHEAEDGQVVERGNVYIACGGRHMVVQKTGGAPVIRLNDEAPEHFCRPAVDVLFRSLPRVYGGNVLTVILTGMGSDGLAGVRLLREAGGYSIAQSEETCVVYGMPKAVVDGGQADEILGLDQIADRINQLVVRRRRAS